MFRRFLQLALIFSLMRLRYIHANSECTEFQETVKLLPELSLSYVMNVHDETTGQGTLTVEAVLQKVGWIGIGFSDSGLMAPSTAIIGLPNEPVSDTNPAKYHITGSYEGGLQRDMEPSFTKANILQNETTTVLTFTIPLLREGEISVLANETNHIIYAYGYINTLCYHADRGSIRLKFTQCKPEVEGDVVEETGTETPPAVNSTENNGGNEGDTVIENDPDKEIDEESKHTEIQSCLKFKNRIQLSPLLTMDYVIKQYNNRDSADNPDGIMSAQIKYKGLGWIGFGMTLASGSMIPAEVIIGLPDEPLSMNNPGKYVLNGRSQSSIELLPEASQTLINSTITQTDTTTILSFHKNLVEPDEIPINGNGQTTFIWAHGNGNDLSVHVDRGAFNLTLSPCDGKPTNQKHENGYVAKVRTSGPHQSLWTAHGVFAGIAWGIIVPLAVASTLLRDMFRNQKLAISIHILLNSTASMFTLIAFIVAIIGRQKALSKRLVLTISR